MSQTTLICNLAPTKAVSLEAIIIEKHPTIKHTNADTTGSIVLEMISPSAPLFNTGDIIRINSAQGSLQNDHLKILAHGNIIRIGDFCKHYSDVPNYSNFEWKTVDNRFVRGSLVAGSTDGWLCDALRGSTSRPGSGKKARI